MSYQRVFPRDLFNEAKLLKCVGRLALLIHDFYCDRLTIEHDTFDNPGFNIQQRMADGDLYIENIDLFVKEDGEYTAYQIRLYSRYNSKDNYPLYYTSDLHVDSMARVFDEEGNLTEEFKQDAGIS